MAVLFTEETQQQIIDLQNQVNELRALTYKNDFSNTYIENKTVIQHTGAYQSSDFVKGSTGWQFDSDGNLEANSGNFRGDITGATGTFSGTVNVGSLNIPDAVTANSFHVDTTGNAWWGATTIGSATAKVLKTGVATFTDIVATGTINAQGGYLSAGVYIDTVNGLLCESGGLNVGTAGHVRGGQTDYNTGAGFFLGYTDSKYKFSVGNPAGEYIAWDGSNFTVNGFVLSNKGAFGGDGSDSAKTVSSSENIDFESTNNIVVKNYTTLTINASQTLGVTNIPADGGVLWIKVSGDCVINGTLGMSGQGAEGGAGGTPGVPGGTGGDGTEGFKIGWIDLISPGAHIGYGSAWALHVSGGGGGASHQSIGTVGEDGPSTGGGAIGVVIANYDTFIDQNLKIIAYACGSGGGGSGGSTAKTGATGGHGGMVILLEVAGDLTYGASSTLDASGEDGADGGISGSDKPGGGGGGAGGQIYVLYSGTLDNKGVTIDVTGGAGGICDTSTPGEGDGGAGGAGDYYIVENYNF